MSESEHAMDQTPGLICWNELMSKDVPASAEFYTSLFGWKTDAQDMGGGFTYTSFQTAEGRPVGGLLPAPPEAHPMWGAYVTVSDLDAAVAKASSLGAKVLKEITDLPMGRFAFIADPQGASIGLWQFKC